MSIGAGIFLIAAGAILAFGIRDTSAGPVNLTVAGIVIMLAGAAGIWLSYNLTNQRRRVRTEAIDPAVEEEYRTVEQNQHAKAEHYHVVEPTRPDAQPAHGDVDESHRDAHEARPATAAPSEVNENERRLAENERTVELDPAANGLPARPVNRGAVD